VNEREWARRDRERFEERYERWAKRYGRHAAFALAAVWGSREKILALGEEGTQVVAVRSGEYRPWDPETLGVDEVAEGYFLQRIQEVYGEEAAILSEEAGRLPDRGEIRYYIVSDPFDGSQLYRRRIPAFWYTTLAVYTGRGEPLAAAVCDVPNGLVDFANAEQAFTGRFVDGELVEVEPMRPAATTSLKEAVLETYLMKVPRLYPACEVWKPLLSQVRFILPNGGPAGYADVAKGRVDIYLALEESHIENFSALPIAWAAGVVVSDFEGRPVRFEDNINKRYFLLCTPNETLHEQTLAAIQRIDWKSHPHYARILAENPD
jgi:fructose-1,6-bisphosphatase/inositol monophosphatase family enzyme